MPARRSSGPSTSYENRAPILWIAEEEYLTVIELLGYPGFLPLDYAAWRRRTEEEERGLSRAGRFVVRVAVRPGEFKAWCDERGLPTNSGSVDEYVAERVYPADQRSARTTR